MKLNLLLKEKAFQSVKGLPNWLKTVKTFSAQIQSLREVLGMTQTQLARRSSKNSRLIRRLEQGHVDPQLSTLKAVADGLNCDLIVQFVPKKPLNKILKEKALEQAKKIISFSKGTAAMEEQEPEKKIAKQQLEELTEELLRKKRSLLWED
ncbi:MAG: helix-turn-helix domain-containing protein [Deltaproteobacteria bacterium]|nr:helix-turn-helix domain-containing protein [Deltaproteobacteria bacterium]